MVRKRVEMEYPNRSHVELALRDVESIFPKIERKEIARNIFHNYLMFPHAWMVAAISAPKPLVNGAS